jgi:hypothetical protein
MKCANPNCVHLAENLFEGKLRLIEMTVPPETRTTGGEEGFPICHVPSRYFWLCPDCSDSLAIESWTPAGLLLRSKSRKTEAILEDGPPGSPFPVREAGILSSRRELRKTS